MTGAVFVHAHALCESADVGAGTRVWAFAHVMKRAVIGRDCNIGDHAFVEAGARVGDRVTIKNQVMIWDGIEIADDVFIGPGVIFTNDLFPRSPRMQIAPVSARYSRPQNWLTKTRVGQGASIGAGCVILPGILIGAFGMIAAGAVVTRSVPEHALMMGSPARRAGWVCHCGSRLKTVASREFRCPACAEIFSETSDGECISLAKSS